MQYDKVNGDMAFNEAEHKYVNTKYPDRKYTSVTTLIGKYYPHFDSEFWSSYKAMEAILGVEEFKSSGLKGSLLKFKIFDIGILEQFDVKQDLFYETKQAILDSYKKANEDACDRGTKYHNEQEAALYTTAQKVKIEELGWPVKVEGEFRCERHNFQLNDEYAVLPEYLVYWSSQDGIINLAGQIDILVKEGNKLYILDHKTNAKGIEFKSYFDPRKKKSEKMFYPLNQFDNCSFTHYTLQLSLYAWMLQQINPDFTVEELWLLHIDGEGNKTEYPVEYVKGDVERMIKHYKKTLIGEEFRDTGKMPEHNNL
jgi:ATP-dependent exoDNAse (exonuclease V) beta subunit